MKVSWVIPCYQEAAALDAGLPDLLATLASMGAHEIVFVDDGSTDGTADRLSAAARGDPRVRVVSHAANRGVGAAIRTGLAAASGDAVVTYDADRTYPAADAKRLVDALEGGADVATASPFLASGGARIGPFRRLLSWGASFAYRRALGSRASGVRTFTCGFRAYRAEAVRGLAFRSDGFPATAEILGRLLLRGARVVEVPSTLTTRSEGRSKMRVLAAVLGHVRVAMRLAEERRFDKGRAGGGAGQPVR